MPAEIELAFLANAATYRDSLLSVLDAGITNFAVPSFPAPIELTIVAQFAFTEPDLDRPYEFSIMVVDPAGTAVVEPQRQPIMPSRPPGADPAFPYLHTVIQKIVPLMLQRQGYYEVHVALEGLKTKQLKFNVRSK
jgi:hypothetical protein